MMEGLEISVIIFRQHSTWEEARRLRNLALLTEMDMSRHVSSSLSIFLQIVEILLRF